MLYYMLAYTRILRETSSYDAAYGSLESTKEARAVQGRSRNLSVLDSEFSFNFLSEHTVLLGC